MIAIGFLFFIIGFVLLRFYGVSYIESVYLGKSNIADKVGTFFLVTGILFLFVGILKFLWFAFP